MTPGIIPTLFYFLWDANGLNLRDYLGLSQDWDWFVDKIRKERGRGDGGSWKEPAFWLDDGVAIITRKKVTGWCISSLFPFKCGRFYEVSCEVISRVKYGKLAEIKYPKLPDNITLLANEESAFKAYQADVIKHENAHVNTFKSYWEGKAFESDATGEGCGLESAQENCKNNGVNKNVGKFNQYKGDYRRAQSAVQVDYYVPDVSEYLSN